MANELDKGADSKLVANPIARSPNLGNGTGGEGGIRISDPYTFLWGEVFAQQYGSMVLSILQAMRTPREGTAASRRAAISDNAITCMLMIIGQLAGVMGDLPITTGGQAKAGPPFDLDPALIQPASDEELAKRQLASLDRLETFYEKIEKSPEFGQHTDHASILATLRDFDKTDLPAGSQVIWRVTLANKKSAVNRDVDPPKVPTRPTIAAANAGRIIDGGTKEISGAGATSDLLVGRYATTAANGSAYSVDVELGRLRTDGARRLIVCGGRGFSSAPPGTPIGDENAGESYYKNPNWHDDVADGPVDALVKLPGVAPVAAENSAWVIVAPPDFAPAVDGVITLFDDLSFDHFGVAAPGTPSFDLEIQPIINRVRRLQWVHSNHLWQNLALNDPDLRSKDASKKTKRNDALTKFILKVEGALSGDVPLGGPVFRFLKFQRAMLDAWAAGNFDDTPAPVPSGFSAEGLTRSALKAAVGQRFWRGIEGGIILLDPSLYIRPFDQKPLAGVPEIIVLALPNRASPGRPKTRKRRRGGRGRRFS
jgi:hypothetical protein